MAAAAKTEPKLEPSPVQETIIALGPQDSATLAAVKAEPTRADAPKADQLGRIEDKAARIEEKFARSEERMMRVESALEKATIRLEGASQDMNLQGVKDDIARLREQVGRKPGAAAIFVIALLAALVGAAVSFALTRYGIPGLIR